MEAAYEFKICKLDHSFHFKAKAGILGKECQEKHLCIYKCLMQMSRRAYVAYISVALCILCMSLYVIYEIQKLKFSL